MRVRPDPDPCVWRGVAVQEVHSAALQELLPALLAWLPPPPGGDLVTSSLLPKVGGCAARGVLRPCLRRCRAMCSFVAEAVWLAG